MSTPDNIDYSTRTKTAKAVDLLACLSLQETEANHVSRDTAMPERSRGKRCHISADLPAKRQQCTPEYDASMTSTRASSFPPINVVVHQAAYSGDIKLL